MLGRSLSKAVQGSEGNRRSLPSLGRHTQHDFQGLEDGDKPDSRAVRVAVCAGDGWRGLTVKAGGRNGGISAKTADAGKSGVIVKEAFAAGMRRLRIARAERGVRGNSPAFFGRRSPAREPRAAAKATRPPLGAKGARGFYAAAYRLRQAGRRAGVGRQGHGQGGTIDADGLRPLHEKLAVKRRMHPQFTRTASGF